LAEIVKQDEVGMAGAVGLAAAALGAGRVVIIPTDTIYGLAAAVFRPKEFDRLEIGERASTWDGPVAQLYEIKRRPLTQPSIILARDWQYAQLLSGRPLERIERFCKRVSNPVTFIVRARHAWGPPTTNDSGGIAIRVPDGAIVNMILKFSKYLYSVSANYPGGREPQTVEQVPAPIFGRAALVVDAGPSPMTEPSFIVDCTAEKPTAVRGDAPLEEALARHWL
jgi:tRNA threonylcarbamoyl adenosine modification protein (Sua5/YciO/YrdC/YwlC family)